MSVDNNGQAPRARSVPVVIASDQVVDVVITESASFIGYIGNKYYDSKTLINELQKGSSGAIFSMKYTDAVARGLISGATLFSSNGYVTTNGARTNMPVTSSQVVNIAPNGGVQLTFVSTSAQDKNTTGTGIWTVLLSYIEDTTLIAKTEVITMNGTTPVTTVASNIRFVNGITRLTAGENGVAGSLFGLAEGSITAKISTIIHGQINAGMCVCESSYRMIPSGKVLYPFSIIAGSVSGGADRATFTIDQWSPGIPFWTTSNSISMQDSTQEITLEAGRSVPAGNIIGIQMNCNVATTANASILGVLENV